MLGGWVWEALQAPKALVANGDNSTLGQHVVLSQKKKKELPGLATSCSK